MIFTPEERRAILGLLGLLMVGQGAALLRDDRKARPDRELSAWLTRAQAARAESLRVGADLAGVLPGVGQVLERSSSEDVTQQAESNFEGTVGNVDSALKASDALEPVPIREASSVPAGIAATGRIAVNQASAGDLEALPGIGPSLAKRIVEERMKSGPFRSPSDLLRVKGIGPKKLATCQDRIDWTP